METADNKVFITMFHKFSFKYRNKVIDSETMKSEKLVKLFTYLLMNHQRSLPSSDLFEICFGILKTLTINWSFKKFSVSLACVIEKKNLA